MNTLKFLLTFIVLGITLAASSSCSQTFKGAGEDIEHAGDEIQDATN